MTTRHEVKFTGRPEFRSIAQECGRILSTIYTSNNIGETDMGFMNPLEPLEIEISEKGGIEITSLRNGNITSGMAIVTGMLGGVGLGLGKKISITRYGVGLRNQSPVGAGIVFESFSDLVTAVNKLAESHNIAPIKGFSPHHQPALDM